MATAEISQKNSNPLADVQRERSGAQTFEKYQYQYHWAFSRLLEAHEKPDDYIIFLELFEDVVVATSTDQLIARFEFNQIKNFSKPTFSKTDLTSLNKNKKNSILGKMLLGVHKKSFTDKLNSLNLVVSSNFRLTLKETGKKLLTISFKDLQDSEQEWIKNKILQEFKQQDIPYSGLDFNPISEILRFIYTDLPDTCFDKAIIGKISTFIENKNPGVSYKSETIYRIIINEMHKKGAESHDFTDWDTLVRKKGITRLSVEQVFSSNLKDYRLETILKKADRFLRTLDLNFFQQDKMSYELERYHNLVNFERSLLNMKIRKILNNVVEQHFKLIEEGQEKEFIKQSLLSLAQTNKNLLDSIQISKEAMIIYEAMSILHEKNDM